MLLLSTLRDWVSSLLPDLSKKDITVDCYHAFEELNNTIIPMYDMPPSAFVGTANELVTVRFKKELDGYKKDPRSSILGIAKDISKKIKNGASLVQLITGMIYEGPQLISALNQDLAKLLQNDGYKNISDAIGVDVVK
jgi:hypothetical protein